MVKLAIHRAVMKAKESRRKRVESHGHGEKARCIVKRGTNACEGYDERKVYGSAYAACYVVMMNEKECEQMAGSIARSVTKRVHRKKEIPSKEIARLITKELKKHNPHAAFMYETHRDLA